MAIKKNNTQTERRKKCNRLSTVSRLPRPFAYWHVHANIGWYFPTASLLCLCHTCYAYEKLV